MLHIHIYIYILYITDNNTWTLCIGLKLAYSELYLDKD